MEFTNEFAVPTDTAQAWSVLTDVPRIAPCLPGASVEPLDENSYSGTVAIKVGPIKVSYSGTATFRELDREALRMVLDAQGKEQSGKGSASAQITVTLHNEAADKTRVHVHTDLQVTGKLAQFGRSAMADVGARLIAQFADNLENLLAPSTAAATATGGTDSPARAGTAQSAAGSTPAVAPITATTGGGNELDALALITPLLKRALPSVGAFALGVALTWLTRRLRKPDQRQAPHALFPQPGPYMGGPYVGPYGPPQPFIRSARTPARHDE